MHKGTFFRRISSLVDFIINRQKETYFIIMVLGLIASTGYGIYFYNRISGGEFVTNPQTAIDYLLRPTLLSLFVVILLVLATLFFAMVLSLAALRKLKVFKMEVEFGEWEEKQRKITNNVRFTSSVLKNNSDTIQILKRDGRKEFPDIIEYLTEEFNELSKNTDESVGEADIILFDNLRGFEKKMYNRIIKQHTFNTLYKNSIFEEVNTLLGVVEDPTGSEKTIVRMRKPIEYPIDEYDRQTLESLLAHAINLKDLIVMIDELEDIGVN